MTKTRKIACAVLSLTMAATLAAGHVVATANSARTPGLSNLSSEKVREVAFDNLTGQIDLSNVSLSQLAPLTDFGEQEAIKNITGASTVHTIIVSLDAPSVVEEMGEDLTVAEYLNTDAGSRTLKQIKNSQDKFVKSLSSAGISFKVVARYSSVINAVAVEVNTAQYGKILKMNGVSSAGLSMTYSEMSTDIVENYSKVYGTGIYDSTDIIKDYGIDGSGVTVAILDTGLDYTHNAFSHMPEGELGLTEEKVSAALAAVNGDGSPKLIAAQRTPGLSLKDVYLNDKVPFAYDYSDNDADVYPSYSQHGTHVAGIVAGKDRTYINKDGEVVDDPEVEYDFMGVAPEAQLVICKVFTDDLKSEDLGGATSEDIVAALDDCVTLGVDIINMSLGTTSGFSQMRDEDVDGLGFDLNRVYNNIKDAGISLISAAGNEYSSGFGSEFGTNLASNPDSGTVGSPSTYAGALSVASVNGQKAPYMLANPSETGKYAKTPIYYNESNDANSVPFDFAEGMLGKNVNEGEFTYLVIPGTGEAYDYSAAVRNRLNNKGSEKIIVVVRRGNSTFQAKVEVASDLGADGIIIYNNVPGTIRMSLGDIDEDRRIPAVSVNMDAGTALAVDPNNPTRLRSEGKIALNKKDYAAGPFMNDYSSWGATPDLKLKPDITAHGGEITSTVSGGYEEMSGTSMATPNLAGLMALVKNYLKTKCNDLIEEAKAEYGISAAQALTRLTNQIVMSSATLLYNEGNLPYSPRKQGAGLATLKTIFETNAYLYTVDGENKFDSEDGRPKIELGEDEAKDGVYTLTFHVKNFGESPLSFNLVSRFMTETLSADGLAVAETAHMLDGVPAEFKVNGTASNGKITVAAGDTAKISVTLKLSSAEKKYLNDSFKNGMYVEGFISLVSENKDTQCDLNLPFMGFYGDWEQAPMLDMTVYEQSAIKQDTSLTDDQKRHESVFATQLVSTYYNGRYALPMGGYAYLQDESLDDKDKMYITEDYCSVSRFNIYNGPIDNGNYMTSTGIRALYAGLLRNAELVTYDIYNVDTGELVYQGRDYSVGKAYSMGGTAHPGLVDMKLNTDALGLKNNEKYEIEFNFYMYADDEQTKKGDNTFSSTFYADFEAPILESSRIRYVDRKSGNKVTQEVWLELDVYDNHYPQAVLLCYSDGPYDPNNPEINLATDYVTPIYKPDRNTTNTVSIEITDFYEQYKDNFYVQIDDYALNHSVFMIYFDDEGSPGGQGANSNGQGEDFNFVINDRVSVVYNPRPGVSEEYHLTLDVNEMYRVELNCGTSNASNYVWSTNREDIVRLKNNELFGVRASTSDVEVHVEGTAIDKYGNKIDKKLTLKVTVVDTGRTLSIPSFTFGVIKGVNENLQAGSGSVKVKAGQEFTLTVKTDAWYYPIETLEFEWKSSNPDIASVDQNGNVVVHNTRGSTTITATAVGTTSKATVQLNVADPFDVSNFILNHYYGSERVVKIPDDRNIMYIGEEAFKDNNTMEVVIIPRTVVEISERAFRNCTALKEVYFIEQTTEDSKPVADLSALNLILADAFMGCSSLNLLDLTNVKVITVANSAFANTPLKTIRYMKKIGIADAFAFANTALEEIDITGLHTAGMGVFQNCTELVSVETDNYTAMGIGMFAGCESLESIEINNSYVPGSAFEDCKLLATVTFGGKVTSIGDYAFANTAITVFNMPEGNPVLGDNLFAKVTRDKDGKIINIQPNTSVTINWPDGSVDGSGAIYIGNTLIKAPATVGASFTFKAGTTAIGDYAFADCTFATNTLTIPGSIETIGIGAFARTNLTSITISSGIDTIPAYAFMQSALTSISIPAGIISIGEGAFAECSALANITFAGSALKTIGDGAFSDTAITQITLPDGVETMGNMVFVNCEKLVTVVLPSVQSLGDYTFEGCLALTTVTFGDNAKDSGKYTFFPGVLDYEEDENGKEVPVYAVSALTTVNLGGLTVLKEGMFIACVSLTGIDLNNVTEIGDGVFASCNALATVTGLEHVTKIGSIAFAEVALTALNLASAVEIGSQAFINVEATSLTLGAIEKIGSQAFAGIQISELKIPQTLKSIGDGAFMAASRLTTIIVDGNNSVFFERDNVLYRNVVNAKTGETTFELCLYPAGRLGKSYTVIEGTYQIQGYAFAWLGEDNKLETVTMPYSLKSVGPSAFYGLSNITRYNFESIQAPRLLTEYYDLGIEGFNTMYYRNFLLEILQFMPELISNAYESPLEIGYPSNGKGYDSYVFRKYFGTVIDLGELEDDNTRELRGIIDGFYDIETINGWALASFEDNEANKKTVTDFCDLVKNAHRMFNNVLTPKQLEYLNKGVDRAQKLSDTEEALKAVKKRFGYAVNITSVAVAENSNHKSNYKVGETFDKTGLVIVVNYDDYTSETVSNISAINLRTTGALYSYNNFVQAEYGGVLFRIPVTVSDNGGSTPSNPGGGSGNGGGSGCKGGCGSTDFGSTMGGTGLMILTMMGVLFIAQRLRRKNSGK